MASSRLPNALSVALVHGGVHEGVAHEGGGDVADCNVGALADLVVAMGAEGSNGREGRHHAAGVIHGVAEFDGRAVGVTREVAEAAEGGEHGGIAGVTRFGAGLSVGGQGHHDDVGLDFAELGVAEAEAIHNAGAEVFQHHVGDAHEVVGEFQGAGFLEVEGNGTLAGVDLLEGRRGFAVHGVGPAGNVEAGRRLDLDDVCAQGRKDHASEGTGGMDGEVGDADAV